MIKTNIDGLIVEALHLDLIVLNLMNAALILRNAYAEYDEPSRRYIIKDITSNEVIEKVFMQFYTVEYTSSELIKIHPKGHIFLKDNDNCYLAMPDKNWLC